MRPMRAERAVAVMDQPRMNATVHVPVLGTDDLDMEAASTATPLRPGPQSTDAELVTVVRLGDDRAFEELYSRYHRRISAYVFGMVKDHGRAEDLTQEVFMASLRRMRGTDRPIAFKPWVYEIAKNACIDQFRRSRRGEEVSLPDDDAALAAGDQGTLTSSDASPVAAMETKQQLSDLQGAFGGLSASHHEILVLREFEGLSYREIGERMGMSRPSVESTLFRARKRLTEEYDELVSGERCRRVHSIIAAAETDSVGARDQRRIARHVSHCQPCRRHAAHAGLGDLVPDRSGIRAKAAAFLPLPAFLRDRWLGTGSGSGDPGSSLAAWATNASPAFEAGWGKAMAAAATIAVAGVGAGAATQSSDSAPSPSLGAGLLRDAGDAGDRSGSSRATRSASPGGSPTTRRTTSTSSTAGRVPTVAGAPRTSAPERQRGSAPAPTPSSPAAPAQRGPAPGTASVPAAKPDAPATEPGRAVGGATGKLPIVGGAEAVPAPVPVPPPVADALGTTGSKSQDAARDTTEATKDAVSGVLGGG